MGITAPPVENSNQGEVFVANNLKEKNREELVNEIAENETSENIVQNDDENIIELKTEEGITEKNNTEEYVENTKEEETNDSKYIYYQVEKVTDGDTIKILKDGDIITLRLIGLDTPETVDPRKPVQCFGVEASNKAKELLSGTKVRIETDPTQGEFDIYGRLLAYVYREDGLFYNKYMIEQGFAHEYTYNLPYKYQAEFKTAEKEARDNLRGLWSSDTCDGDTTQASNVESNNNETENESILETQSDNKYYTSSHWRTKYYYPASCESWQELSPSNLKVFNSLEELLIAYPTRTLNPNCD
ncbi:MAG: thermonuclease family protein [Patescibacteria group bacterium]